MIAHWGRVSKYFEGNDSYKARQKFRRCKKSCSRLVACALYTTALYTTWRIITTHQQIENFKLAMFNAKSCNLTSWPGTWVYVSKTRCACMLCFQIADKCIAFRFFLSFYFIYSVRRGAVYEVFSQRDFMVGNRKLTFFLLLDLRTCILVVFLLNSFAGWEC